MAVAEQDSTPQQRPTAPYKLSSELLRGLIRENPVFALLLGMCPTLGVTTSAVNGLGMGIATSVVLIGSNVVIAAIQSLIPDKVRIPAYIVVIASFVTIIDLSMAAYVPDLHAQLGLFIPLIVVNCIVLGRAEAFASSHSIGASIVDGITMGLGFTIALTLLGFVRELLGAGSVFGMPLPWLHQNPILVFVLPPGAFLALGFMIAAINRSRKAA